jgi:hypothetical protein
LQQLHTIRCGALNPWAATDATFHSDGVLGLLRPRQHVEMSQAQGIRQKMPEAASQTADVTEACSIA